LPCNSLAILKKWLNFNAKCKISNEHFKINSFLLIANFALLILQ